MVFTFTLPTFTIFWLLFPKHDSLTPFQDPFEICANCTNYWAITAQYLQKIQLLEVHVLQGDTTNFQLNDFAKHVIKNFQDHNYYHIFVKEHFLDAAGAAPPAEASESKPKTGHFLIAWNSTSVHKFLSTKNVKFIPQGRDKFVIILPFSEDDRRIEGLMRRLWEQFWVVDVFTVIICTPSVPIKVFAPFDKFKGRYGRLIEYDAGAIINNPLLLSSTLADFNQYPFNVSFFELEPAAVPVPKYLRHNPIYQNTTITKGLIGLDANILIELVQKLNFRPIILKNEKRSNFGRLDRNGRVAGGSLAQIFYKEAIYAANNRLMLSKYTPFVDYTLPFLDDKICLVVPKADKMSNWWFLVAIFDKTSSTLICVLIVGSALILFFTSPNMSFLSASFKISVLTCGVPLRLPAPVRKGHAFLLAWFMIFNVIFFGVIQGVLFKKLTQKQFYPDINTIEGFLRTNLTLSEYLLNSIPDENEVITQLRARSVHSIGNPYEVAALNRSIGVLNTKDLSEIMSKSRYFDKNGFPLLHLVEECLASILDATIVPKGSPFLKPINRVIGRLYEGGFTRKWLRDIIDGTIVENLHQRQIETKKEKGLSLFDITEVFVLFVCSLLCCCVVLCYEILTNIFENKK